MCNTVSGEGEQIEPLVHCPVEGASMPLAHCASCSRLRTMEWSLGAGALFCRTDEGVPRTDRRADLAEVAARAPLHMMLERDTTCVTADVGVIEVKQLMAERGLRSVAVVDAATGSSGSSLSAI